MENRKTSDPENRQMETMVERREAATAMEREPPSLSLYTYTARARIKYVNSHSVFRYPNVERKKCAFYDVESLNKDGKKSCLQERAIYSRKTCVINYIYCRLKNVFPLASAHGAGNKTNKWRS